MKSIAFIPARGGSKSLPLKNIAPLDQVPLINYVVAAAKACSDINDIVVSTDHPEIAALAESQQVTVDQRPAELGEDDSQITDTLTEFLSRQNRMPDVLVLLQPTSPFILPEHISQLIQALAENTEANSSQTLVEVPHHQHGWNQRVLSNGLATFAHPKERKEAYNKQRKPMHYLFGNAVAIRSSSLMTQEQAVGCFTEPSIGITIDYLYGFDCDGPRDFPVGEALLKAGMMDLPHMKKYMKQ